MTNMTGGERLKSLLLLLSLHLSGVRSDDNTVFVYSKVGDEALLLCSIASSDCSSITWTFFRSGQVRFSKEVIQGQVNRSSEKASRLTVASNCSLILRDLALGDVGSYVCLEHERDVTTVYLSILAISSPSNIMELRPGGTVVLSCILSSYYDAGNCRQYSGGSFKLRWLAEEGTEMDNHSRHQLTERTHCNATLVLNLQKEDNGRRWRCQVETKPGEIQTHWDFTSSFLFENTSAARVLQPPADGFCYVRLPISRIVLCVALPLMVGIVGLVTWVSDKKRNRMLAAALQHDTMGINH
uniref:Ig-like domain-containing protein n=1 Tax=Oryzias latipes TaxID=8090 RepID=A0A3P9HNF7_ORYLA